MATPKTILLKGEVLGKEAEAAGAIIPGELLELDSDGKVVRHSTAAGAAAAAFARELEFAGGSIDDEYESGDTVPYYIGQKGAEFYARLAAEETIAIGALLESAGNGQLREVTTGVAIAVALEAVTTGESEVERIKVEVL